jgi:hypothetical protein
MLARDRHDKARALAPYLNGDVATTRLLLDCTPLRSRDGSARRHENAGREGADIALKNTDGVTAGQIAAKNNFSDIAVFLAKPAHRKYQRHSGA